MSAGTGRGLVLASVFVCAACGLVYELELVALATYLTGDSVTQSSVVLSVMVFAMGIGSLLVKRLRCRAATGFAMVEALLALVGGGSAMALYAGFAWFGGAQTALVGFSLAIGMLIGAEMPLLMTLIQRIRRQDAGGAVADLFAADYVGALVGGLTFPFLLLPFFGQLTGALLTGVVNSLAGGVVVLWLFRHDVGARVRWGLLAVNGAVVVLLLAGTGYVGAFEQAARQEIYGEDVRVAVRTGSQEAVLTGDPDPDARRLDARPLQLFVDGRLRVSSADENRFHASLVDPALAAGPRSRVLILGGDDGAALRQVLRHEDVREVTVVEVDPAVVELARRDPGLSGLNDRAYDDPRVRVETGTDAFARLREHPGPYDVVISDLPGPAVSTSAKLYSQEFYGLVSRALAPHGRLAVHAGAARESPRTYWTVVATVRSAGLITSPYLVGRHPARTEAGPHDWGFVLAHKPGSRWQGPGRRTEAPTTLTGAASVLPGAPAGVPARQPRTMRVPPSTLTHPRY